MNEEKQIETHRTYLEEVYPSGAERWTCPDSKCGRSIIIQWHPFKRITLIEGDIYAPHSGAKGGATIEADILDEDFPADLKSQIDDIFKGVDG